MASEGLLRAEAVTGTHVAGPSAALSDPFFKSDSEILKTYAFDYELTYKFKNDLAWASLYGMALIPPCSVLAACCICGQKLCGEANIRDRVNAQHLALTRDGIRYVVDRHKAACRLDCQEQGKISKTIPYDKMTDCDIEEPAGASGPCCCLVANTLTKVNVDTASSGQLNPQTGKVMHELQIEGLIDADQFKRDVWSMKRGEPVDGVDGTVAPMAVSMVRDASASGGKAKSAAPFGDPSLVPLLQEQTRLLREIATAVHKTNELLSARDTPPPA